jgi:hypothetical protein
VTVSKRGVKLVDRLTLPAINTAIKLNHDAVSEAITNVENAVVVTSFNERAGDVVLTADDVFDVIGSPLPVNKGGTGANLAATGGASRVLKQTSVGGAVSVAQLAAADLSNGVLGSGSVVLASGETGTGSVVRASSATLDALTVDTQLASTGVTFVANRPLLYGTDATFSVYAHLAAYADAAGRVFGTFINWPTQVNALDSPSYTLTDSAVGTTNCTYAEGTTNRFGFIFEITSSAAGACSATVQYSVTVNY